MGVRKSAPYFLKFNDSQWRAFKRFFLVCFLFLTMIFAIQTRIFAQSRAHFAKQKIQIGKTQVIVEIADTPEKTSYGLMHRHSLGENDGMLFIFPQEQPLSFWMKNTFIALSIGFFDKEKRLIEIKSMKPAKSEMQTQFETYTSSRPAQYALEMRPGWFEKNHIKVGDKLHLFIKK